MNNFNVVLGGSEYWISRSIAVVIKFIAYDKYGITNMWRPIMILNRCANITDFNFKFIRYYNIQSFSKVMSVLISRVQHDE